jgi:hypothetical protein
MAVALDVAGSLGTFGAAGSPATYTGLTTAGSLANGAIVAMVTFDSKTPGVTSVTWGGQTMTAIPNTLVTSSGASGWIQFYGLVGVTHFGAQNLVVTFTGGTLDKCICACSWTGVDQTGGATSFPNGNTTGATSTAPAITITSATNNAVMAAFADLTAAFTSTNNTNLYLENALSAINGAGLRAAGASSVACSTNTIASQAWIASGHDIAAASTQNPFIQTDWPVPGRTTYDPRVQQQINLVNQQTNQQTTQGPVTGSQCM